MLLHTNHKSRETLEYTVVEVTHTENIYLIYRRQLPLSLQAPCLEC